MSIFPLYDIDDLEVFVNKHRAKDKRNRKLATYEEVRLENCRTGLREQ